MSSIISPLTGQPVETIEEQGYGWRLPVQDGFVVNVDERLMIIRPGEPYEKFTQAELQQGWALVRSKAWRALQVNGKRTLVVPEYVLREYEKNELRADWSNIYVLSLDREIEEARRLSFTQKAFETLRNYVESWERTPEKFYKPRCFSVYAEKPRFSPDEERGTDFFCYGCTLQLEPYVYDFLYEGGYFGDFRREHLAGIALTPKAFMKVEEMRGGRSLESRQVFFIRPWDDAFTEFFAKSLKNIKKEADCEIEAVWDKPHNEKIDERIFRQIREAGVVMLLVAPNRFNVGLEAGYALALNKPIVAFREKPPEDATEKEKEIPFDIRTLNVYDYTQDNEEDLVRKLSERILAGFEEMKIRALPLR